MACPTQSRIKLFSDGELSMDEMAAVLEHIEGCKACEKQLVDTLHPDLVPDPILQDVDAFFAEMLFRNGRL